jgi:RNA polymerase sigma-70 factor (ECF subfamily)
MEVSDEKTFEHVVENACEGDPASFEYFYQTYATPVYRFLYFKTGKREIAEDLMQDVFLKLCRAQKEGYVSTLSKSYLYTIAKNTLTDYYRKKKSVPLDESVEATISDETMNLERTVDVSHTINHLHKSLDLLTEEQREVITMRFIEDLSNKEIAGALGKREDAIRQLQARALKTLRAHFSEYEYE